MNFKSKVRHLINPDYPIIDDLTVFEKTVKSINEYYHQIKNNTDSELKSLIQNIKNKLSNTNLDEVLVEIYAIAKVVCSRKLGMTPYDVQLIGAIAMHQNRLIEMQTGEGKTLTAVLPIVLNALTNKGVHVLTFNDYLAKRDAEWMNAVYAFFGLTVSSVNEKMTISEKREAYQADITYATAKTVGFDYLRDFMAFSENDLVQRPYRFAIVDEADAILIDEGRNPLVLAGDVLNADLDFYKIAEFVKLLEQDKDYEIHDQGFHAFLIEGGVERIQDYFKVNIHEENGFALHSAINLALFGRLFLKRDEHYIVREDEVLIVDEFTGRVVADRKWRNGLQTAIEAKEGVSIKMEGTILNSITLQHFIQKYPKLAGMTATAQSASEEFFDFYNLKTVVIPQNKPCIRVDHDDMIFSTLEEKYQALVKEVRQIHKTKQPILIGTLTVKESELIAEKLKNAGINCIVLNAKNDAEEAEIIAKAGQIGAVTISTNMAGRGTDIKLGGIDESNYQQVLDLGGLYVIGTNRHESLRIDRQLRGRSGRQGDIGLSRFFVSFQDDLMVKYKLEDILPKKLKQLNDNKKVQKAFNETQGSIENCLYDVRKNRCEYSDFVERQRELIQNERQELLFTDNFLSKLNQLFNLNVTISSAEKPLLKKLKTVVLYQYDTFWAAYLNVITQVRENIHVVKLGGQNPIREFRERGDEAFIQMCAELDDAIHQRVAELLAKPSLSLEDLGVKPPTSTWTFVSSDNPFENQLAVFLMDNGNIGFQVDPMSAGLIFMKALYDRRKRRKD